MNVRRFMYNAALGIMTLVSARIILDDWRQEHPESIIPGVFALFSEIAKGTLSSDAEW